jgi:hypothetical protein
VDLYEGMTVRDLANSERAQLDENTSLAVIGTLYADKNARALTVHYTDRVNFI